MRHYPEDRYDNDHAKELGVKPWMLQALLLNPGYMGWGPHEDYMIQQEGRDYGWAANLVVESWDRLKLSPDDLNVIPNFYFEVERESKQCGTCGGSGNHPEAQWVTQAWYSTTSPFTTPDTMEFLTKRYMESICGPDTTESKVGRSVTLEDPKLKAMVEKYGQPFLDHCISCVQNGGHWSAAITQDEADALWEGKRLGLEFENKPTAEQVNLWAKGTGMGHDAINQSVCCEARLKRLGIPQYCPECDGNGHVYTVPEPHMELVLWLLHPRKGASRAVTVKLIKEEEVGLAVAWLRGCHKSMTHEIWRNILKKPRPPKSPKDGDGGRR